MNIDENKLMADLMSKLHRGVIDPHSPELEKQLRECVEAAGKPASLSDAQAFVGYCDWCGKGIKEGEAGYFRLDLGFYSEA